MTTKRIHEDLSTLMLTPSMESCKIITFFLATYFFMLHKFPTSSGRCSYKSHKFKTWNTISSENTIDLKSRKDPGYKIAYSHNSRKLIINPFYWRKVWVENLSSNSLLRGVDFQTKKESKCIFPCFKEKRMNCLKNIPTFQSNLPSNPVARLL